MTNIVITVNNDGGIMSELKLMEEELKERGVRWQNWPRLSEEERNQAEDYYNQEVMPLLIDVFTARERSRANKKYGGMILSLGTSYEPLVLSIMALQPERACFLFTDASRRYLDPVIKLTGLAPSRYESRKVDKDNPLQIYQAIKDVYREWGRPENVAVDFTGGTKSMSGGSAMAGGLIGADMVYVASNEYIANLRRPFPGSEHLEFIPNPYQVFGDLEEEKALDLMAKHDYSGARRIFDSLRRQVPDPRRYTVLSLLCRSYEAWDNLDIAAAKKSMAALVEKARQYSALQRDFILAGELAKLVRQRDALEVMETEISNFRADLKRRKRKDRTLVDIFRKKEFVLALVFTLYCSAKRREEQGKYDMASLLIYRLLELISQVRLAAGGLDTVDPDYSILEGKDLLQTINTLYKKYNNNRPYHCLPENISLFQGYVILAAMGDEIAREVNLDRLRGQVRARNYNIFAHGFDFVDAETCVDFRRFVEEILCRLLSDWGRKMTEMEDQFCFINPVRRK